jgi:hypothetical protein
MKLSCEVTEFVYSTEPKYGSFLVSYKDGKVDRNLLVKCFVEELKHIKANVKYTMHVKIESKYWAENKRYSTSAFLISYRKQTKFNPEAGFDRRGLDKALWKNEGK